jgi:hypothetical protein
MGSWTGTGFRPGLGGTTGGDVDLSDLKLRPESSEWVGMGLRLSGGKSYNADDADDVITTSSLRN